MPTSDEYRQIMDVLGKLREEVAVLVSRSPVQDRLDSRVSKLEKSEHRRLGWAAGVSAAIAFVIAIAGYLFRPPGH